MQAACLRDTLCVRNDIFSKIKRRLFTQTRNDAEACRDARRSTWCVVGKALQSKCKMMHTILWLETCLLSISTKYIIQLHTN